MAILVVLHLSPKQPPPPIPFSPPSAPSFLHPFSTHRFRRRRLQQKTLISSSFKDGSSGSSRSPSETECPVPLEQQPINEYQNLSTSFPFSWAALDSVEYASRLFVVGASFALFVGLPVAWSGAYGAQSEPLKPILAALSSGILVVSFAVVRMYLGWAYVGNRLLSATVEYEETGWYDGQIWVKTAEVLARDRLLGSFSVKPVLSRLKYTLVTLAASLFACVLIFTNVEATQKASFNASENNAGTRAIPGSYNDDSARSFEPDAFCGEPGDTTEL